MIDVVLRSPGQSTGAKRELRAFEFFITSSMGRPLSAHLVLYRLNLEFA